MPPYAPAALGIAVALSAIGAVALCVLIVGLLTLAIPDLRPVHNELMTLLITLALAVIGGYSLEDAARAGRTTQSPAPDELRDLIKDVLMDVVNDTPPQS